MGPNLAGVQAAGAEQGPGHKCCKDGGRELYRQPCFNPFYLILIL